MAAFLLDSQALLGVLFRPDMVSRRVVDALESAEACAVSVVSPYELEVKRALGNLPFGQVADWEGALSAAGLDVLPLTVADGVAAARLPLLHKDPWDRLLIARALNRGLAVITSDRAYGAYGVETVW